MADRSKQPQHSPISSHHPSLRSAGNEELTREASNISKSVKAVAWNHPRLAQDWCDTAQGRAATTAEELFMNCIFVWIFNKLNAQLRNDESIFDFALSFIAVWGVWAESGEYGGRFNDDDLFHKCLWMVWGFGLFGVLIHLGGGVMTASHPLLFRISVAWCSLVLAAAFSRCGRALPKCQRFCEQKSAFLVCHASMWLLGYMAPSWAQRPLIFLCNMTYFGEKVHRHWNELVSGVKKQEVTAEEHHSPPLGAGYLVTKTNGLALISLGQVAASVGVIPWYTENEAPSAVLYATLACAILLMFMLKLLMFDVEDVSVDRHAASGSAWSRLLWLCGTPIMLGGLVGAGTGINLGVQWAGGKLAPGGRAEVFGGYLICNGVGLLFLSLAAARVLHAPDPEYEKRPELKALGVIQLQVLAAAGIFLMALPLLLQLPLFVILGLVLVMVIFQVAFNFLDEFLILEEVEENHKS